ncbi:MAG: carboxymuconolactone decarboxylase family protein [Candidatus Limnocylindria bacterium]
MPWIKTVPAEEATGVLAQMFVRLKIERGRMFTPYEILTNNGPTLEAVAALNQAVRYGPSDLSRAQREMIAAYVSALNDCTF